MPGGELRQRKTHPSLPESVDELVKIDERYWRVYMWSFVSTVNVFEYACVARFVFELVRDICPANKTLSLFLWFLLEAFSKQWKCLNKPSPRNILAMPAGNWKSIPSWEEGNNVIRSADITLRITSYKDRFCLLS